MPFKDPPKPPAVNVIELDEGQYTPIPGSTKVALFGPGSIKITHWPNGGHDGEILEGKTGDLDHAVRLRLERVAW